MRDFFGMDGPIYKIGNVVGDILLIGILWMVFFMPLVTAGAATSAAFYVMTKRVSNKDCYIFKDFFKSFKLNIVRASVCWMVIVVVVLILSGNIMFIINKDNIDTFNMVMLMGQICVIVEILFIWIFLFPILARFDMKIIVALRTAFFMAHKHLLTTFICAGLFAAILFVTFFYYLPLMVAAMGIYSYVASKYIMKIFKIYRPEIDGDPVETVL